MRPNGVADPVGVGQGVGDRQAHVGQRQLGDGGAVGELDHRVHDRLRVHHHLDAVVADAEQLVGLDHLEALVHQRRRVDGDLRTHRPGGMGQGVVDGDVGQLGLGAAAERPAGRGEHDAAHPVAARARPGAGRAGTGGPRSARCRRAPARRRPAARARAARPGRPAISDSLLASASRLPAPSAASVTPSPAKPTTPLTHTSPTAAIVGQRVRPGDAPRCPPAPRASQLGRLASRRRWRRPRAATAAPARASSSTDDPAPSATTVNRSGSASITSSACVPIDPVDPAIDDRVVTRQQATDATPVDPAQGSRARALRRRSP